MSDFVLGNRDIGYFSSFTGGSWKSAFPIRMLNRELITAVARSTTIPSVSDITFDFNLKYNIDIEVFGLVNHNLTSTGTYRFQLFSDIGRTSQVYDSGTITVGIFFDAIKHKTNCHVMTSSINSLYARLTLSDPSNTDGYFELGRVFVGERFYPNRNMTYGMKFGVDDSNSSILESESGIEHFVIYPKKRTVNFSFKHINNEKSIEYSKMQLSDGVIGACLFEFDPSDWQEGVRTFLCRNTALDPLDYNAYNLNSLSMKLTEVI